MVSFISTPTHFSKPHIFHSHLKISPISSVMLVLNHQERRRKYANLSLVLGQETRSFRFLELGRGRFDDSVCCWCRQDSETEVDVELETEILAFMEKSHKPNAFPTKKELEKAGRFDLVEAIKNRGGWFSLGWDVEDDGAHAGNDNESETAEMGFDIEDYRKRVESFQAKDSLSGDEAHLPGSDSSRGNSSQPASSSGRSLDTVAEEDSGIEGILNRLEKERNSSLGINLRKHGYGTPASTVDNMGDRSFRTTDTDRTNLEKNGSPMKGSLSNSDGELNHRFTPATWRTWSIQRAGLQDTEFEAGEIALGKSWIEGKSEASRDDVVTITDNSIGDLQIWQNDNHNEIKTRLQHLELELSSTLHSLKSKGEELNSKEVLGSSPSDLLKLSDAWEFQENEVMNARERLRSIRAKLAVLEGKMALAMTDAQKILEEKQKKIDGASKALQRLRTARIVWPNTASEVLLVGSFDGWTTQRKMKKSRTGIFSVSLKLYPGRYEIKFIVDGIWKVDPLRPIVHNDGYENNLLIIT